MSGNEQHGNNNNGNAGNNETTESLKPAIQIRKLISMNDGTSLVATQNGMLYISPPNFEIFQTILMAASSMGLGKVHSLYFEGRFYIDVVVLANTLERGNTTDHDYEIVEALRSLIQASRELVAKDDEEQSSKSDVSGD